MTLDSIIGTSFIAVAVFLAVYRTFKPPEPDPVDGANGSGSSHSWKGGDQSVERADMLAQRGQLCCHRRLIGSVLAV